MTSASLLPSRTSRYGEIWQVAYPLILMNSSHTLMQLADRKFLSMRSSIDVAAALPAGVLCFTLFCFFLFTTNYSSVLVSQYFGREDQKACARAPWAGVYFALIAMVLCFTVLPLLGLAFLKLGGHPPEILSREMRYFLALIPSGGFVCLTAAFTSFFSGRGKTLVVGLLHLSAAFVNIGLNYMLIFGKLGFPELGILGAGLGTSLANVYAAAVAFWLFWRADQQVWPTRSQWRFHRDDFRRLVRFGAPSGLQFTLDVGGFTVFLFVLGRLGGEALAATTIALSINMLTFMPMMGVSDAVSILVGRFMGRGEPDEARKTVYAAWNMALVYTAVAAVFFLLLPEFLFRLFGPGSESALDFELIIRMGRIILACAAVYVFFDATYMTFLGALKGAGDTRFTMYCVIFFAWGVLVPGSMLLIRSGTGIVGMWIFLTGYIAMLGATLLWRFRQGVWRDIRVVEA